MTVVYYLKWNFSLPSTAHNLELHDQKSKNVYFKLINRVCKNPNSAFKTVFKNIFIKIRLTVILRQKQLLTINLYCFYITIEVHRK